VPKTSLDGGDAALARSGPAGVFDVTFDGRGTVGLRVSRSVAPCVKRAAWHGLTLTFACARKP
jgi:hypothetical protein